MNITKRNLLLGVASITAFSNLTWGGTKPVNAAAHETRIRHNAASDPGKEMLKLYAKAVENMRQSAMAGSSSDWTYQWYVHHVRPDQSKQQAIDLMYTDPSDPRRKLADLTWSTCQPHVPGSIQDDFLPWHRAYVYVFEQIVRAACGDDSFTLPYWDYTNDAVIPKEFRSPDDPEFASLYIDNRNDGVNDGQPISNRLILDSMNQKEYRESSDGVLQGFNKMLDRGLHGNVHVDTGDNDNMGQVPWAARDPIFWLHHCNIDRIWAGWNAIDTSRENPSDSTWRDRSHAFTDKDGNQQNFRNEDVTSTDLLNYGFDELPKPPPPALLVAGGSTPQDSEPVPLARSTEAVSLATGPVTLTLARPLTASGGPLTAIPSAGTKRYLILSDVTAKVAPGTNYDVHANRPGEEGEGYYLGTINFFGAGMMPLDFVLDVTEQLAGETNVDPLQFTFIPTRPADPNNDAQIGAVTLVEK